MIMMAFREEVERVQTTVAQYAAKAGFSVYIKNGNWMTVKYRLPYRPGMALPIKPEFKTIAEIEIRPEEGSFVVRIEPKVFGNLRPKIDELMASLAMMGIGDLRIVKV